MCGPSLSYMPLTADGRVRAPSLSASSAFWVGLAGRQLILNGSLVHIAKNRPKYYRIVKSWFSETMAHFSWFYAIHSYYCLYPQNIRHFGIYYSSQPKSLIFWGRGGIC
jgi:hypothetical protein